MGSFDPWDLARRQGLCIVVGHMPGTRRGLYEHRARTIHLSPHLTRREARCTLAHELAHAAAGDTPTLFGPLHARQERRARRTAASWLIAREDYERAAAMFEGDCRHIANELDVTLRVLQDYVALVLGVAA